VTTPEKPDGQFYLNKVFENFEKMEQRLEAAGNEAITTVTVMMNTFRKVGLKIFDEEETLYEGLDAFKKLMHYTDHLAIDIDLRRRALSQPEKLAEQALRQAEQTNQQQVLPAAMNATNPTPVVGEYGFYHWRGDVKRMNTLEKIANMQLKPQMMTTERQQDFLNYAKDLPPELNRLYDWLGATFLRVKRFPCQKTRVVCYSQLRTHLEKLTTLTIGFSGAIIDFRMELVSERQVAYAQASFAVEQARYLAQAQVMQRPGWSGPIPTSGGATSQTLIKRPRGGPYTPEMSSGVTENE
jgi:hypothetical protein